jgi:hypothetical protein
MLVTVQRVARGDREGINAFVRLHGDVAIPRDAWAFVRHDLGREVVDASRTDLPPGGNPVLAWLDLVADDDVDEARLHDALARLDAKVERPPPVLATYRRVTLRFATSFSREPRAREELRELGEVALAAVRRARQVA